MSAWPMYEWGPSLQELVCACAPVPQGQLLGAAAIKGDVISSVRVEPSEAMKQ
jgi:hypothetical protein